jgi:hypothetical protein
MPRKSEFDGARLNRILQEQHLVISRAQAFACGMSRGALQFRVGQSGPWQRLLPGVYLGVTGTVTQDQREVAALLYAGQGSMITGVTAVRRHHLRSPGPDSVDVLIPWNCKRQSIAFVRIHRTRRMPERLFVTGKIRFTMVPRAVADAARSMARFDDVRAVVCEAVQRTRPASSAKSGWRSRRDSSVRRCPSSRCRQRHRRLLMMRSVPGDNPAKGQA